MSQRRDRRGRGMRGPMVPSDVPAWQSRSRRFDALVLDAIAQIAPTWQDKLRDVDVAVEHVPVVERSLIARGDIPFGRVFPKVLGRTARVVVYRGVIEHRAATDDELADMVQSVVLEQVGAALGVDPRKLTQ